MNACFRAAVIEEARAELRDVMLDRVCAFGLDPAFTRISAELAKAIEVPEIEAADMLLPVSRAIYRGAAHVE